MYLLPHLSIYQNNCMQNIEDLVKQIISSTTFKDQIQKQLKQYLLEQNSSQIAQQTVTLPQLVGEINGYISQITEIALEQENSKNYITFMKRNQVLCFELEKKFNARIESLRQQISCKMDKVNLTIAELVKTVKKNHTDGSKLKQQRKVITKNLLETSKLQNSAKTESTIHMKSFIKSNKLTSDFNDENEISSSLEAQLGRDKNDSFQKQWRKYLQIWENKMETALQPIKKDYQSFTTANTQLTKSLQTKLQGNLQSIWNVISDLCSRISKFQALENYDEQP